ncbi:protein nutcracker [Ceratitis capitata]|uniref:(Mediterranean fruit fly) hypothetical protein n=1 Tax=Ceratitis capitata TaxID=7213 RepID=W8CBJ6_CERCA|nr:protein nutcracker [Ceratitis capitata]CAD7003507.1 unnamed protein product [Ceratitis capitata]
MDHRNTLHSNFYGQARVGYWLRCSDLPCVSSPLSIVGRTAPQSEAPTTSSSLAFRYTKPTEIIQEKIRLNQLLIADTTLHCAPLHLQQFFHHYNVDVLSSAHILFLLVYLIALECGFVSKQLFKKFCRVLAPIPTVFTYHSKNVLFLSRDKPIYQFSRPHETYFTIDLRVLNRDFKHGSLYSRLTALVSGDYLLVTLAPIPVSLKSYSTCLPISRFVMPGLSKMKPVNRYLRRLDQLTAQLRDEIFTHVRNQQLDYLKLNPYPSITGMPLEVREVIYEYLNETDLKSLSQVSNKFYNDIEKPEEDAFEGKTHNDSKKQAEMGASDWAEREKDA